MNITFKDEFTDQINKMMATGQTEQQAIDSVKRIKEEMRKNPDMFLQPYIIENGHKKPNPAFRRRYGDPEKILADTQKNVGRTDHEYKLAMDKDMLERRKRILRGEKVII